MGLSTEDPSVTRINNQILLLEEIFESRRNLDIKRPSIKEHVFAKMDTGIASPAFLKDMKVQRKEIDKYLKKNGMIVEPVKIEENSEAEDERQPYQAEFVKEKSQGQQLIEI